LDVKKGDFSMSLQMIAARFTNRSVKPENADKLLSLAATNVAILPRRQRSASMAHVAIRIQFAVRAVSSDLRMTAFQTERLCMFWLLRCRNWHAHWSKKNSSEIIADNLKKAGWSWGCVSALDREGRTIWIVDAHRDDGKRFIVRADAILTAFLELEAAIRAPCEPKMLPFSGLRRPL
jgi:hypothetical protein